MNLRYATRRFAPPPYGGWWIREPAVKPSLASLLQKRESRSDAWVETVNEIQPTSRTERVIEASGRTLPTFMNFNRIELRAALLARKHATRYKVFYKHGEVIKEGVKYGNGNEGQNE
ncbi:hypothetical protein Q31a_02020 [Aureliella helgolandensis]|uniref:Uncharacterized protein n=1 Tax=Aureliella helgolandensis TaxID=2527968 RepID=A0A518G001_9BACT|nr:hypothetical protein Q31a_02020 [Aureliella helgolandensis]